MSVDYTIDKGDLQRIKECTFKWGKFPWYKIEAYSGNWNDLELIYLTLSRLANVEITGIPSSGVVTEMKRRGYKI